MELEEVFSSKSRMKILKIIHTFGSLNASDVARRVKMNYADTNQHLKSFGISGNFAGACVWSSTDVQV